MRRIACVLLALLLCAWVSVAQEHAAPAAAEHAEAGAPAAHGEAAGHGEGGGHGDSSVMWKWANFAILLAGIGYMAVTKGGPFFRSRNEEIRQGIAEAAEARKAADARYADIERRLKNLDSEIVSLRANSKDEMNSEAERIRRETADRLAKVHTLAEQEIGSITKAARQHLKDYAASLAVELAERRIREQITPQMQEELIEDFAAKLPAGGVQ